MQKLILVLGLVLIFFSCNRTQKSPSIVIEKSESVKVSYAEGFSITSHEGYKVIRIQNPWPGSEQEFKYALIEKGTNLAAHLKFDAVVKVPVERIVVTSTTHIPSLEMLGVSKSLVGFPNMNYISSDKTRALIDDGKIKELGKNENINTEVLIDLSPDLVVGFAVDGDNKTFDIIEKTGIPIVYNGDWTETTPLGKAEWIKFFGAFFMKEKKADSIFNHIKSEYLSAKQIAMTSKNQPTVLSGAMYKDVWYLPQGNSWAAEFIRDAKGMYLWNDTEGTGSLSLNLESVVEKGQAADFWIGPGQFTSLTQLRETHSVYTQFDAFKNQEVYSFTSRKGATGGVLYYELAPNRPDLVLKDIIKILHPELLSSHELYFFTKLD